MTPEEQARFAPLAATVSAVSTVGYDEALRALVLLAGYVSPVEVAELRDQLARVQELERQWTSLMATESEIMTMAQRNAWHDALTELRIALGIDPDH